MQIIISEEPSQVDYQNTEVQGQVMHSSDESTPCTATPTVGDHTEQVSSEHATETVADEAFSAMQHDESEHDQHLPSEATLDHESKVPE